MATVPVGAVVWMNFDASEGAIHDNAGQRIAIDAETGALLSLCPVRAYSQSEYESPTVLALDDGRFVYTVSNLANLYSLSGARVAFWNWDTDPPADTSGPVQVYVRGTNHTSLFYYAAYYSDPVEAPWTLFLTGGTLDPDTGEPSAAIEVDSVTSDGSGIADVFGDLCIDSAGILYYFTGDDPLPENATITLKAYDLIGDAPVGDVATYAPGDPYPNGGFAFRDGSLLVQFSDGTIQHLNQTTGAVIFTYGAVTGRVFAGLDDTTWWLWDDDADPQTLHELATVDGTVLNTPPLEDGYTLRARPAVSVNPVEYAGCTPPPGPGTRLMIRRERQFLLPSSDSHKAMFIPELEVLLQPGVGNGDPTSQGVDPQLMFSISKDGGKTFGPEQWASAGTQGQFTQRVRFRRTPNSYRDGVVRIVATDPVDWTIVDVVTPKITEGTS